MRVRRDWSSDGRERLFDGCGLERYMRGIRPLGSWIRESRLVDCSSRVLPMSSGKMDLEVRVVSSMTS